MKGKAAAERKESEEERKRQGGGGETTIKQGEGGPRRLGLVPNHPSSLSPCVQRQLRHKEKPLLVPRLYFISYTSGGRQSFIFAKRQIFYFSLTVLCVRDVRLPQWMANA